MVPLVTVPAATPFPPVILIPPVPESETLPVAVLPVEEINIPFAPVLDMAPSADTAPALPSIEVCNDEPSIVIPAAEVTLAVPVRLIDWPVALVEVSETGPTAEVMAAVALIPVPVPEESALILTPILPAKVPAVIGPVRDTPIASSFVNDAGPLRALLLISI